MHARTHATSVLVAAWDEMVLGVWAGPFGLVHEIGRGTLALAGKLADGARGEAETGGGGVEWRGVEPNPRRKCTALRATAGRARAEIRERRAAHRLLKDSESFELCQQEAKIL
uniref:DUF834 domain-containing protein n=1 Tax=Oryza barthii TaxID=65489 RepID=A0A0D3EVG1_9ORYZ